MFRRTPALRLDPSPDGACALRAALALPNGIEVDVSLGDVILVVPPEAAGIVRVDGRPLPAGRRLLLGTEHVRVWRRRVRLQPPAAAGVAQGTRTLARAALASPLAAADTRGPALVVLEGPSAGRRWPLSEGRHIVGRGLEADVVIPEPSVSRRHAAVTLSGGRVRIRDLGSRHGVRIGRFRRRDTGALCAGATVRLGAVRLGVWLPGDGKKRAAGPGEGRARAGRRERWLCAAAGLLVLLGGAISTVALAG